MAFGRLERDKGTAPMSDINMTPLIDVMLVLVVIFIITAPLLASSIKLDLPKTDAAKPNEAPKFVLLVVDKSGQAFLNDKPLATAELAKQLALTAQLNPRHRAAAARRRGCALRPRGGGDGRGAKGRAQPNWVCG